MNKEKFTGIFPALITPFDNEGKINFEALEKVIDYDLEKGVKGFYVCGSTSEVFKLTEAERYEIYKKCAEFAKGRCTLIAHVGTFSTEQTIKYGKFCEELGYDAISAVTPFYFGYTSDDIVRYYLDIANSVNIPLFLYHIPSRSGVNMPFSSLKQLLGHPNVAGMKFTSNDYYTFERLRKAFPEKVLLNGFDEMLICGLACGADGAIGSTYNLIPETFVKIFDLCKQNKFDEALKVQGEGNDMLDYLIGLKDGLATLKFAMKELLGIDCGTTREPCGTLTPEWKENFLKTYKK